jgi:cobaltochelatase CobS
MSRFIADTWGLALIGLDRVSVKLESVATKSQDLFRQAGINHAQTGKMSTAQATRKIKAGNYHKNIDGTDYTRFIIAHREVDNMVGIYFDGGDVQFELSELKQMATLDIKGFSYNGRQFADAVRIMSDHAELHLREESKPQTTESAQTTTTMSGKTPQELMLEAMAMLSGGQQIDEAQVEAIVDRRLKAQKPLKVEVISATATKRVEKAHVNFADAIAVLGLGNNIALIGEAGSGKSFGAIQMAQALDLDYVVESCHGKMQSFDLVGAISPTTGNYISTKLRDAYENGKVLILDEFDRSNTETTIALNGILAGDSYGFPDGMVAKHKDFKVIACQNTFGTGTSKTYASAKPMDGSTRTRFVPIEWDIDNKLEKAICGDTEVTRAVQQIRKNAAKLGYDQVLITPRQAIAGNQMVDSLGWSVEKAIQFTCLNGLAADVKKRLLDGVAL